MSPIQPGSMPTPFESSPPPRDLTAQDLAFLRALYSLPLDRQAMQHRGRLVHGAAEAAQFSALHECRDAHRRRPFRAF